MVWNRYLLHNSSYVNCDMHRYTDISAYLCSCTSRDLEAPNRRLPGNHRVLCRNCAMETRPHWNTRPLGLCFLCRCPWDDITLVSDHDINIWRWECGRTSNRFGTMSLQLAQRFEAIHWRYWDVGVLSSRAAWSWYLDTDLGSTDKLKYRFTEDFPVTVSSLNETYLKSWFGKVACWHSRG